MISNPLSSQQRHQLEKALQAGLNQTAATLQKMLGGEISIRLVADSVQTPGIYIQLGLSGALEGEIGIELPGQMALAMVKTLTGGREMSLLDETSRSVLMEIGNVLASAFVAYFDQSRGLRTLPTPPNLIFVRRALPELPCLLHAEFCWSQSRERAEIMIGLQTSALDILLA